MERKESEMERKESEMEREREKAAKRAELNLKEREKIIMVLQTENKLLKADNARLNRSNAEYEEKLYIKEDEICSLKEKVVDQIEEELNHEFNIEQLTKDITALREIKVQMEYQMVRQAQDMEEVKRKARLMQESANKKLKEVSDWLNPEEKTE